MKPNNTPFLWSVNYDCTFSCLYCLTWTRHSFLTAFVACFRYALLYYCTHNRYLCVGHVNSDGSCMALRHCSVTHVSHCYLHVCHLKRMSMLQGTRTCVDRDTRITTVSNAWAVLLPLTNVTDRWRVSDLSAFYFSKFLTHTVLLLYSLWPILLKLIVRERHNCSMSLEVSNFYKYVLDHATGSPLHPLL